ncbi:MAG: hypothetical protein FGF53_00475 [Candidatus Brockarchaeota archaeon]|nr:hypothetical protein [Candidatus Brockarchaeota archaeon]MBO3808621.1 hypothetical protein [Candidatus Brockarchaeota archaeon]
MNEILEEHLKDALWISLTLVVSFTLLHATDTVRTVFLNKVFNNILFLIGKHADLSAEYGGEFTLSMPETSLFNYSILLNDNEYSIMIHGIRVFHGAWEYRFNSVSIEPGGTYSVKTSENGFVLTKR